MGLALPGAPSGGGGDGRGAGENPEGSGAAGTEHRNPASGRTHARSQKGEGRSQKNGGAAAEPPARGAAGPEAPTGAGQRGAPATDARNEGDPARSKGNRTGRPQRSKGKPADCGGSERPRSAKRAQAPERKSRGEARGPGPPLAENCGAAPRSGGGRPAPKRAQPRKHQRSGAISTRSAQKAGANSPGRAALQLGFGQSPTGTGGSRALARVGPGPRPRGCKQLQGGGSCRSAAQQQASLQARARSAGRAAASVAKRSVARVPHLYYSIFGHYSITTLIGRMTKKTLCVDGAAVKHFAKIYTYPGGIQDIVASTSPDFGAKGWEESGANAKRRAPAGARERRSSDPKGEDLERSMRRARAKLRRLALANDFRWFVTLTIDPEKCDSFDGAAVIKKLNAWCSNMVQRKALRYILVPERHESGRIHFHGFFSDSVEAVVSGHYDSQGHPIFNLPQWTFGFTTAIELYDDYTRAVGYVCKYVGKQGEKPAGRWYYSGGDLREPGISYAEISPADLLAEYPEQAFAFYPPGRQMAVANGIVLEDVQMFE